MTNATRLNSFVEKILKIHITRMGGAFAGILGSLGADSDIVNSLKKTTISFATEYSKKSPDPNELNRLSEEIDGFLQTL